MDLNCLPFGSIAVCFGSHCDFCSNGLGRYYLNAEVKYVYFLFFAKKFKFTSLSEKNTKERRKNKAIFLD